MWCLEAFTCTVLGCFLVFAVQAEEFNVPSTGKIKRQSSRISSVSYDCLTLGNTPGRCIHSSECPETSAKSTEELRPHLCFNYRRPGAGLPIIVCCENPQAAPATNDSSHNSNAGILTQDCGRHMSESISGGNIRSEENTELGEYPWMALLKYHQGEREGYFCGGTLISSRHVLTAAHCAMIEGSQLLAVLLGEHDHTTNPDCGTSKTVCAPVVQEIPVSRIITHEEYAKSSRNHYHDIALLVLQNPAQFNDYVQPICLPFGEMGRRDLTNTRMWIAGWGTTQLGWTSERKQKLKISVSDHDECSGMYRRARIFVGRDKQICAGGERRNNSCQEDSGGPLMSHRGTSRGDIWYLQGILSLGPTACTTGVPVIYTKVSYYLDWISTNLAA